MHPSFYHDTPVTPPIHVIAENWGRDMPGRGPNSVLLLPDYCTVSPNVVVCVVAVTPSLDWAVICKVYVPGGVGRL